MRHPLLVIYENPGSDPLPLLGDDGLTLAELLAPPAGRHKWVTKTPRRPGAALSAINDIHACLLAVKFERKLGDEASLVADAHAANPDCPILVVNAARLGADQADQLTTLAYDLGAACVLTPPLSRAGLEATAEGLMRLAVARTAAGPVTPARNESSPE